MVTSSYGWKILELDNKLRTNKQINKQNTFYKSYKFIVTHGYLYPRLLTDPSKDYTLVAEM